MFKKILIVFVLGILILSQISRVEAYSNKYFDIIMPKDYKITTEKDGTYQWVNSAAGSNYVISVRLKTTNKNVLSYNKLETSNFTKGIIDTLEAQYYSNYKKEVPVTLVSNTQEKFGKYNALTIKLKIDNFLSTGNKMNQYVYILESNDLLYSVVYSSTDKTLNLKELNIIKNSFKIKDEMYNKLYFNIAIYISIAISFFALGYFIPKNKKEKNQKRRGGEAL